MKSPQVEFAPLPARFKLPGMGSFAILLVTVLVFVYSVDSVGLSPLQLINGIPEIHRILAEMFPPDFQRIDRIAGAILETFQMAFAGTALGIAGSFFLAIFASRVHSPHPAVYFASRALVSLFRTVPDLVWALLFVVAVGLGPFAGTLAIMVDTMGFCGRFFAEAMEEVQPGPQEALRASGARRADVIFCAVVPAALPSFVTVRCSVWRRPRARRSFSGWSAPAVSASSLKCRWICSSIVRQPRRYSRFSLW